ncbi:amidohydrolase family protein [Roseovarius sp. D22-M7]|uniref:amidohydrolase family protein n=1 Tax=Roseovarius sp. D22-M7 TaxID=3127116 RepID=UPI00300FA7B7
MLGPHQRVDVMTALKAMTLWPAWQHFEEDRKGSIEVGKFADFVLLSNHPIVVDPETLADLQVMAAIKEDTIVFEAERDVKKARLERTPFNCNPDAAHWGLHALADGMSGHYRDGMSGHCYQ